MAMRATERCPVLPLEPPGFSLGEVQIQQCVREQCFERLRRFWMLQSHHNFSYAAVNQLKVAKCQDIGYPDVSRHRLPLTPILVSGHRLPSLKTRGKINQKRREKELKILHILYTNSDKMKPSATMQSLFTTHFKSYKATIPNHMGNSLMKMQTF